MTPLHAVKQAQTRANLTRKAHAVIDTRNGLQICTLRHGQMKYKRALEICHPAKES